MKIIFCIILTNLFYNVQPSICVVDLQAEGPFFESRIWLQELSFYDDT